MINQIEDISAETETGQLLIAAIAMITTESRRKNTPNEILEHLQWLRYGMYNVNIRTKDFVLPRPLPIKKIG